MKGNMIKIGLLVGVSTDEQAKAERGSIDDQIKTCRHAVRQLGGVEVNCYIMDGFSRTGYDSLAEAMADIPPLGEAVRDAEADKYDVLMLDNFDRLGDLGILLSNRFKKIRKQLYSARQSGRLQDPATYDPYADDATDIGIGVGFLLQKYRLAKLQRGYKLGMKKRAENGLHPNRVPIGYLKAGKDKPFEIDPIYAPIIIMLKDRYLQGASLTDLERMVKDLNITTQNDKPFLFQNIRRILRNPFYAGKVFHGSNRGENTDALTDGLHKPLWTWEEHLALLDAMSSRYRSQRSNIRTWSGVMNCSVCGKRLKWHNNAYRCKYPGTDHITLRKQEADYLIPHQIVKELKEYQDNPIPEPDTGDAAAEIDRKIEKVQRGYENELYTVAQAQEKIADLRKKLDALRDIEHQREIQRLHRDRFLANRQQLLTTIEQLPEALRNAPPIEGNRLIRSLVRRVTVTPQREVKIEWTDQ